MTAILALFAGSGAKLFAAGAAALAGLATLAAILFNARKAGADKANLATAKVQEANNAKAAAARNSVAGLSDDAAVSRLHEQYDRRPK